MKKDLTKYKNVQLMFPGHLLSSSHFRYFLTRERKKHISFSSLALSGLLCRFHHSSNFPKLKEEQKKDWIESLFKTMSLVFPSTRNNINI